MDIKIKKTKGLYRMRLNGEMTIIQAIDLKNNFLDNLEKCKEIEIDLSGVTEIDTAGFQILCLIKKEAEMADKAFKISSCSSKVSTILELYNMNEHFGLEKEAVK